MSGESPHPGHSHLLIVTHPVEGESCLRGLFYKVLVPFMRNLPSRPNHLPPPKGPHLLIPTPQGLEFQHELQTQTFRPKQRYRPMGSHFIVGMVHHSLLLWETLGLTGPPALSIGQPFSQVSNCFFSVSKDLRTEAGLPL